ncbi:MAG: hypothetical protein GY941_21985 [Planctomycetes bacterium]|nr:hypothetical protein [Planctomycetota bacterium]
MMEDTAVIIYYCYGLNFKKVAVSEVDAKVKNIKELIKDGAGEDGRQMRYIGSVPFKDFSKALIRMI